MSDEAKRAIRNARELKEEIVRERGVGEDLIPMLMLYREHECVMVPMLGERDDNLAVITAAIAALVPDMAVFVFEGYGLRASVDTLEVGELARRFADGDPAVYEMVGVNVFRPDGCEMVECPYRYAGRSVEWVDVRRPEGFPIAEGAFPEAAIKGYALGGERGDLTTAFDRLAKALVERGLNMVPMGYRVGRNDQCPCGSGQKFKRCHGR